MQATPYFTEQVLRKRPYIAFQWCEAVIQAPLRREAQPDGRIRFWGAVVDPRDGKTRHLRMVTLDGGVTMHNAIFDQISMEYCHEAALLPGRGQPLH